MKNLLLSLLVLITSLTLQAQVSYTAADYGVAGDSLFYSTVTGLEVRGYDYGQAGANVNWNFSGPSPSSQVTLDYLNPLTAGYERAFVRECVAGGQSGRNCKSEFGALTNLAFKLPNNMNLSSIDFSDIIQNDELTPTALNTTILGYTAKIGGIGIPFTSTYTQPDRVISFPITYGNADSSESSYEINLNPKGLNFIYLYHAKRVNHVDGWGSVTTPYTTYASTVREFTTLVQTDTIIYNDTIIPLPIKTTFAYNWYDPAFQGPVYIAQGNIDSLNRKGFTQVSFLDTAVCLKPVARERHYPREPILIDLPGTVDVKFNNFSKNANTYSWNFDDPGSGTADTTSNASPTHVYSDSGTFNVQMLACNNVCGPEKCDTLNITIVIIDTGQVEAFFYSDPSIVCAGQQVQFENTSNKHATNYYWNFGDIDSTSALDTSTAVDPVHTYADSGTYTVTLIAYNANESQHDTARRTVTVQLAPNGDININGPTTFCHGDSVILTASGSTIYQWSNDALTPSITVRSSGVYSVTETNSCGTKVSQGVSVTVQSVVDTLVALGSTDICQGDSVRLQASSGPGLSYHWWENGRYIIGADSSFYYATTAAKYYVNVIDSVCVGVSNNITVAVSPAPVSTITTTGNTTLCSGDSILLTAAIGRGYTYQWQLNGNNINGATASSYYASGSGSYTAVVTLNHLCSVTSNSIILTVNATPTPVITYQGNPAVCAGDSLYLSTATGNGASYQWQDNGQAISGATSYYYYASTAGTYTVVATVNGCSGTSAGVVFTVNQSPTANAGGSDTIGACSSASVTIGGNPTATGGKTPYTYAWSPINSLSNPAASNPTVSNLSTTTEYYVLVTDANGCTATDSTSVVTNGTPISVTVNASGASTWCAGADSSATLIAVPSGGAAPYTYSWSPATGLSTTTDDTTVASPTLAGTYDYVVIATDSNGCQGSGSYTVTVTDGPTAVITALDTTSPCRGDSVTLAASPGLGYTYQWIRNSQPLAGSTDIDYTTTAAGNYSVSVTSGQCSAVSEPVNVSLRPNPVAAITPSGTASICSGDSVNLEALADTAYTYQWYFNNFGIGGATDSSYYASDSGTYYYIADLNGCTIQSGSVVVGIKPPPFAIISTQGRTAICSGDSVLLTAAVDFGYTYQWQLNGQNIPGAVDGSYYAKVGGAYTAIVTAGGCSATSNSIILTVGTTPTPVISYQGTPAICSNDSFYLSTSAGIGYTFQWQNNGQAINGATSDYYYASTGGTYTVVVSSGGCSATATGVSLTVNQAPTASAGPSDTLAGCSLATVTIGGDPTASGGTTPYTISWTPTNGLSDPTNSNPTVSNIGSTTVYYVLVSDANGCTATDSTSVVVTGVTLTATVSVSGPSVWCQGSDNSVTASVAAVGGAGGAFTYDWSPSTGLSSTTEDTVIASPTAAGTYDYSVVVTDSNGCQASSGFTVQVIATPSTTVTALDTTAPCQGDSVTLSAANGLGYTYQWLNNSSPIAGSTSINFTTSSAGSYSVSVTSGICSAVSTPVNVTIRPNPSTAISPTGNLSICFGSNLTLSALTDADYVYQWYQNDFGIAGATDSVYSATDSGSYYYIVGLNGCFEQSDSVSIAFSPGPVSSINAPEGTSVCEGDSVLLSATTGDNYTYQWQLNNQNITGATDSTYSASASGSYTALVTYATCSLVSNSIIITVNPIPAPVITYQGNPAVCSGDSIYFSTTTGNGSSYQWSFNGSPIGGATSYYYYASTAGLYTVDVTTNGCSGSSDTVTLSTNPSPVANAGGDFSITACGQDSVIIGGNPTASGGTGPLSTMWSPPIGLNDPTLANPTVSNISSNTVYYVVVTDANGCTATDSATVTVAGIPIIASITSNGPSSWCAGTDTSVTLIAVASGGAGGTYTYLWSPSTGLSTTTDDTTEASPTLAGTYTYNVLVTDSNGCEGSSGFTVQVIAIPVPTITALDTTAPCQGDSVTLAANPGNGFTYQWLDNNAPIPGETDINFTTDSAGTYSVEVTSGVCSAISNGIEVTIRPLPSAAISANGSTTICEGNTVTLEGSTGDGYTYQWYENDFGISGANNSSYNAGDSSSYYYIVGLNGCSAQSDSIFVIVNQYPLDSVTISGPTDFCAGGTTTLTASTGNGYSYQWQQDGQSIGGETSGTLGVDSSGIYSVAVTAEGCTATSTGVQITVNPTPVATITSQTSVDFCAGDSVTLLTASTGNGYSYQWLLDGEPVGGATNSTYQPSDSGTFSVAISASGCSDTSNSEEVNVLTLPLVLAYVGNDGKLCPGDSIIIYASQGTGYTYQWQLYPGTNIANATSDSLVVIAPGIYDVVITSPQCGKTSFAVTISFDSLPTITQVGDSLVSSPGLTYQWYSDSTTLISGATSQYYVPTAGGTYNVMVTDSLGCTQESLSIITGISTVNKAAYISMYPNPAHDEVNVVLNSPVAGTVSLKINDMLGNEVKIVYEGGIVAGKNFYTIPLSSLAEGVYMLSIFDGQTTVTQKLVKE